MLVGFIFVLIWLNVRTLTIATWDTLPPALRYRYADDPQNAERCPPGSSSDGCVDGLTVAIVTCTLRAVCVAVLILGLQLRLGSERTRRRRASKQRPAEPPATSQSSIKVRQGTEEAVSRRAGGKVQFDESGAAQGSNSTPTRYRMLREMASKQSLWISRQARRTPRDALAQRHTYAARLHVLRTSSAVV